jgi:hypothetical protein
MLMMSVVYFDDATVTLKFSRRIDEQVVCALRHLGHRPMVGANNRLKSHAEIVTSTSTPGSSETDVCAHLSTLAARTETDHARSA